MLLSKKLYKLNSTKLLIIAIVVFMLFVPLVMPIVASYTAEVVGENSPDLSFYYTANDLYDMADEYGEDGRRMYVVLRFTFDLIFPLIYLFFLVSVTGRLLLVFPEDSRLRLLILLPVAGGVFDYLENIFASIVVGRYPVRSNFFAVLTPYFSMLKWVLLGVSFILIVVLGIYVLAKLIKGKIKTQAV